MRVSTMTVFLVLMSLGAVGCVKQRGPNAHGDPKTEQAWRRSFIDNGFSYCDAQVLASFWRVSVPDAKLRAGHKLQTPQGTDELGKLIWTARDQAVERNVKCDIHKSGISEQEITLLANYWGVSLPEARLTCQDKLLWGGLADVRYWITEAQGKIPYDEAYYEGASEEQALFDLYLANFSYCDAEAVGHFWGMDTYEAKMTLGQKIKFEMPASEIQTYVIAPAYEAARAAGVAICQ